MRKIAIFILLLMVLWACNKPKTEQENKSKTLETNGFELLFDGETSKGWRGINSDSFPETGGQIENGSFIVNATDGCPYSFPHPRKQLTI